MSSLYTKFWSLHRLQRPDKSQNNRIPQFFIWEMCSTSYIPIRMLCVHDNTLRPLIAFLFLSMSRSGHYWSITDGTGMKATDWQNITGKASIKTAHITREFLHFCTHKSQFTLDLCRAGQPKERLYHLILCFRGMVFVCLQYALLCTRKLVLPSYEGYTTRVVGNPASRLRRESFLQRYTERNVVQSFVRAPCRVMQHYGNAGK